MFRDCPNKCTLLIRDDGEYSSASDSEDIQHTDRVGVSDLSVSGDKFDLVVVDPHDPTMMSETRSANAIAEPTPDGYQPCQCKISLITKIIFCPQSKNEQEKMRAILISLEGGV